MALKEFATDVHNYLASNQLDGAFALDKPLKICNFCCFAPELCSRQDPAFKHAIPGAAITGCLDFLQGKCTTEGERCSKDLHPTMPGSVQNKLVKHLIANNVLTPPRKGKGMSSSSSSFGNKGRPSKGKSMGKGTTGLPSFKDLDAK